MSIRVLPSEIVNRIAAGEVVERPASAVKELVENSLDAGASRVDITIAEGGKALIAVDDNGKGIAPEELPVAILRHATSKLPHEDLFDIGTFGFRGEALPSIASVARMEITSRAEGAENAAKIKINGGEVSEIEPAARGKGTRIEVRDLFFATPARLKFLKSNPTEARNIAQVIETLALAYPEVAFTFADENRKKLDFSVTLGTPEQILRHRMNAIIGKDFWENSVEVNAEGEGILLKGRVGLPTYSQSSPTDQFLFVNQRPVKDKLLVSALRGAYQDLIAAGRYPAAVLFLEIDRHEVDVNVHPAKTEVRFRNNAAVRSLIVGGVRNALANAGHRANHISPNMTTYSSWGSGGNQHQNWQQRPQVSNPTSQAGLALNFAAFSPLETLSTPEFSEQNLAPFTQQTETIEAPEAELPLGVPVAQVHGNYIIAAKPEGLVIIDQHAAHERLTFEIVKQNLAQEGKVKTQILLLPEVVELKDDEAEKISERAIDFAKLGLVFESFGSGAILVRETPAILGKCDIGALVRDIIKELNEWEKGFALENRLMEICATFACHSSIRSGRKLTLPEMNALLRQMENTPFSGQCGHGRPTHIEISLYEIEKRFGRK